MDVPPLKLFFRFVEPFDLMQLHQQSNLLSLFTNPQKCEIFFCSVLQPKVYKGIELTKFKNRFARSEKRFGFFEKMKNCFKKKAAVVAQHISYKSKFRPSTKSVSFHLNTYSFSPSCYVYIIMCLKSNFLIQTFVTNL